MNAGVDFQQQRTAAVYKEYQAQLRKNNALDFDDLIMKTVELFQNCPRCWTVTRSVSAILWWTSIRTRIRPSSGW